MNNDILSRLDTLVELADLEHQIVELDGGGSGNREYESTLGALEALKNAREALAQPENQQEEKTIGHIIQVVRYFKLFGLIPADITVEKDFYIDNKNELNRLQEWEKTTFGTSMIRYKIIEQIEGTRAEILRAFIRYKKAQK